MKDLAAGDLAADDLANLLEQDLEFGYRDTHGLLR